jgi:hypothetical protein
MVSMVLFIVQLLTSAFVAAAAAGANALSIRAPLNQTYDYIIVGGGTSGLTVANRLTENGKRESPTPNPFSHLRYLSNASL